MNFSKTADAEIFQPYHLFLFVVNSLHKFKMIFILLKLKQQSPKKYSKQDIGDNLVIVLYYSDSRLYI